MSDRQFYWLIAALMFLTAATANDFCLQGIAAAISGIMSGLAFVATGCMPPFTIVINATMAEPEKQPSPFGIHTSEEPK